LNLTLFEAATKCDACVSEWVQIKRSFLKEHSIFIITQKKCIIE
jgi:hypothetical protein